jgi:dipeptidyl aminopeptidase/acylaminoacyl peptidase
MKKFLVIFFLAIFVSAAFFIVWFRENNGKGIASPFVDSSQPQGVQSDNPYFSYSFDSLSQKKFFQGEIKLTSQTRENEKFTTYVFTYQSDGKTISGMANIPNGPGKFPVIVLLRGWVDRSEYYIGLGTERSANNFAEHGFLTLAPDFLGYGFSDWEDQDILLARFYRPVEVLNLIASILSLDKADPQKIGLWGHSNGGQIALSLLEITGKSYPTSLWAPVSLGFPESVLVYMGQEEDVGNVVKEKIDEFSLKNDPKEYSISECLNRIKTPFIIHQGKADALIKTSWTDTLVKELKKTGNQVSYYLYPGENHNFNYYDDTGDILRQRDLEFFQKELKNTH